MKPCPFCAEQIQEPAIVCKHCGRDLPAAPSAKPFLAQKVEGPAKWIGLVVGLGVCALFLWSQFPSDDAPHAPAKAAQSAAADPAIRAKIDAAVAESIRIGAIKRVDAAGHEVLVNPVVWALWDVDTKKAFAVTLAKYCSLRGTSTVDYVDVIDQQSGKKLAKYGPFGFSVE